MPIVDSKKTGTLGLSRHRTLDNKQACFSRQNKGSVQRAPWLLKAMECPRDNQMEKNKDKENSGVNRYTHIVGNKNVAQTG